MGKAMGEDLSRRYHALVGSGDISFDAAQQEVLAILDDIRAALEETAQRRPNALSSWLTKRSPLRYPGPARGLYLWGNVGVGKTMLMDLFFSATRIERKRRVHFHAFMQEIHEAMHRARQKGTADPIAPVARDVAARARLLCFDEMQISDITDAMLVGRLFEKLFEAGVTIVTTSNRAPDDLYKNGLNRQLFLPFIDLIKQKMTVVHLGGETDYRREILRGQETWFSPLGPETQRKIDRIWTDLAHGEGSPLTLIVKARKFTLPLYCNGVARATFADLCEKPLGAGDYLALAKAVRVLLIENIPIMSRANANEAKRFVTLIDTLYEAGTRLICSAEAEPDALYVQGDGAFEFERTASRLNEMRSQGWGHHKS